MKCGIYKITNPKGKVYIGMSSNITRRKSFYRNYFCNKQPKIYRSLLKYGWDNHQFDVIEECDKKNLIEKEIYYKEKFIEENGWDKALFINIIDGENKIFTKESKEKISKAKKGHPCFNDEWREKISKSLREGNHSQYYTQEVKDKISKAMKGNKRTFSENHIKNLKTSALLRGYKVECILNNEVIKVFNCLREAKEWLLLEKPNISKNVDKQIKDCCNGRQKKCHGYEWKYSK